MSFLPLIMLAIPVLFIFLFVRRAKRLIRVMPNPEQLGQLLSQSVRAGDLLPSTVGASPMVAPVSLSGTAAVMNRPLPIDHASRRRSPVPVVAIAVIAAAVAVAFLVR